jgi:hypothetical protein
MDNQAVKIITTKIGHMRNAVSILPALLILAAISLCTGCVTLAPHEEALISRVQEMYKYDNNLPDIQYDSTDNPCVIIGSDKLDIDTIDGTKTRVNIIAKKNVTFVKPGHHKYDISKAITQSRSVFNEYNRFVRSDAYTTSVQAYKSEHFCSEGKYYTLQEVDNDAVFSEITDAATLSEIQSYIQEYRPKAAEMTELKRKMDAFKEHYIAYANANPNRLEGKWVYKLPGMTQVLEMHGDVIKYTLNPGGLLETSSTGKFRYDENTILPNYTQLSTIFGDTGGIDEKRPQHETLSPVYYYTLNGDTLDIKQKYFFGVQNHTGVYVKSD